MFGEDDFLFGNTGKHDNPESFIIPSSQLGGSADTMFIEHVPGASLTAIDISSPSGIDDSSPFGGNSSAFNDDAFSSFGDNSLF